MINIQYIESAKRIRTQYLKQVDVLNKYENDVKKLAEFLQSKASEMEEYQPNIKKIKNKEDINQVSNKILEIINDIELEEKKLISKIEDVNSNIEKLRLEETILYKEIKKRYPTITDEELIREINEHF